MNIGPLFELPYWQMWYLINCPFHIIGNLIKASVLKPLVEHFTAKMLNEERFIRKDESYLKDWFDKYPGPNIGPCTLSFKVIVMMNNFLLMHGLWPSKIELPRKADFNCFTMTECLAWCSPFGRYTIQRFMRVQGCDPKYIALFQDVLLLCARFLAKYQALANLEPLKKEIGNVLAMLLALLPHCWSANSIHHATTHLPGLPKKHGCGILSLGIQILEAYGGFLKKCFAGCTKDTIASMSLRLYHMHALKVCQKQKREAAAVGGEVPQSKPKARFTPSDKVAQVSFEGNGTQIHLPTTTNLSIGFDIDDDNLWEQVKRFVRYSENPELYKRYLEDVAAIEKKNAKVRRSKRSQGQPEPVPDFALWRPTKGNPLTDEEKKIQARELNEYATVYKSLTVCKYIGVVHMRVSFLKRVQF
jgi:hypothetical protein